MLKQRETMTAGAATSLAILARIGISSADVPPLPPPHSVDRELRLAISDGFTRQTWVHGGKIWGETRDTLTFHEDEAIRIIVHNDTHDRQTVAIADDVPLMLLKPGETRAFEVVFNRLAPFTISVIGQPMMSRPVKMRPRAHVNVS